MDTAGHANRTTFALVAIVLLAAGAAMLILAQDSSDTDRSTQPEFPTPCGGAEVSLATARESVTFRLIQPEASLASADRLSSVWACATTAGGIGLVYDSGVAVLESPNDLKDPVATWQRMADQYPEFSVTEIRGIPASLADPNKGAIGGTDFVVGEVRYTVSGDGKIPLEDLVAVSDSLVVEAIK
jgi:hypothetical protein